jgi:hypothetical protein
MLGDRGDFHGSTHGLCASDGEFGKAKGYGVRWKLWSFGYLWSKLWSARK